MQLNNLRYSWHLTLKPMVPVWLLIWGYMMSAPLFALQYDMSFWSSEPRASPLPDFAKITNVVNKKKAFFGYLTPLVDKENHIIRMERQFLFSVESQIKKGTRLSHFQVLQVKKIAEKYQYKLVALDDKHLRGLLDKVDIIPAPLVLIQAAKESGWGSSRFARDGYNFFGQWCYTKGCGMRPSLASASGFHEVKRFSSVEASISAYMRNLNMNGAYFLFRKIRSEQRDKGKEPKAEQLVHGLVHYSQRQHAYIHELLNLLRENARYLN